MGVLPKVEAKMPEFVHWFMGVATVGMISFFIWLGNTITEVKTLAINTSFDVKQVKEQIPTIQLDIQKSKEDIQNIKLENVERRVYKK